MNKNIFYDGTKLLSLKDINRQTPEIYICTTNRNAGKTTYFSRLCVNRFKDKHEKFCLIYRYKYELDNAADKFFKVIGNLFFPGSIMESKIRAKGCYAELYLDGESCGYAIPINASVQIKKLSHLFSDVKRMLFDEFQDEKNHYIEDEVDMLISIHTSIARGEGEAIRYVPLYMVGNAVSILNPYYVKMGISTIIDAKTKFLRGDGYVIEQGSYKEIAQLQKTSGFNRAFSKSDYVAYAAENVYLHDNLAFVESVTGSGRYLCTLRVDGSDYGVREYAGQGIVYVSPSADKTFPLRIAVTTDDHNINYVMLRRNDFMISNMRYLFERGCFRFKDLNCKKAIMKTLSY